MTATTTEGVREPPCIEKRRRGDTVTAVLRKGKGDFKSKRREKGLKKATCTSVNQKKKH